MHKSLGKGDKMFDKAMIATDLWTANFPVEKCIMGLRELGIRDYYLLHFIEKTDIPGINLSAVQNSANANLQKRMQLLEKTGINMEAEAIIGKTQDEINRIASEKGCSLLVLEASKQTRFCELLFGASMAGETLYRQTMPILLITILPSGVQKSFITQDKYEFLNHILFPTDFSVNADYALSYLEKIIERGPKKVTLFHVQNKTIIAPHLSHKIEEFNKTDRMRLEKIKEKLQKKSKVEIDTEICYGHPVREIIKLADARQVSLIVMGSQGKGFLKETFIGSISQNVARCSESPVLLIPLPERDINKGKIP